MRGKFGQMPSKPTILNERSFLLGVGAQKAGTTWLHNYLAAHPEVLMSPVKEMNFFGNRAKTDGWPISAFRRKLRERMDAQNKTGAKTGKNFLALRERIRMKGDTTAYRRFFRKRLRKETIYGEISPIYAKLDVEELNFIQSRFRNTKVLYILRNPVDRLWSQMRFDESFETVEDLENIAEQVLTKAVYADRSDYMRTIQNLESVFAPNQIHYAFYETLFTKAAITKICNFLDVGYRPASFSSKKNVSQKLPLSPLLRPKLVLQLRDQYDFVGDKFQQDLPPSWIADYP